MSSLRFEYVSAQELDRQKYDLLYAISDFATPFHSLAWLEIINSVRSDLKLRFVVLFKGNDQVAYMPFFTLKYLPITMSSVAFGAYGGFIYEDGNKAGIKEFLMHHSIAKPIARLNIFDDDLFTGIPFFKSVASDTWVVNVDRNKDQIFKDIDGKTRNQIRKAYKGGVTYKRLQTEKELDECKKIYRQLVAKHSIKRPYPDGLFDGLFDASKNKDDIQFHIATFQDTVVAFSVFLKSPLQIFYWLNASDNAYSSLNATNGLLANMLEYSCDDNSVKIFNFGAVPIGNDGLLHFKKNWAAQQKTYYSYYSKLYDLVKK